jgi:hypothetical protein
MGFIFGCFMSLIAIAGVATAEPNNPASAGIIGMALGAGAIIIAPILYGIMGFIGGIISAAIYNVLASVIGGIEMEFTSTAGPSMGPPAQANW